MKNLNLTQIVISFISIAICFYYYFTDSNTIDFLLAEDSIFENLTSICLFLTAVVLIFYFFKFKSRKSTTWKVCILILAAGLIFGAGEEISWGQRIFGIESSDFFKQNNAQQETNLHNMVVGGTKINKIIFSIAFSIIFGIYFLFGGLIYNNLPKLKSLINMFGIPIPTYTQSLIFLISTGVIMLMNHSRKWELWEFIFAFTILIVFYKPLNRKEIY